MQNILTTLYLALGVAVALAVHEVAEAYVAMRLGDRSAQRMGWLRLDVRAMADPFGTFVLPAILLLPTLFGSAVFYPFAYAKPMPLNPWSLRRPGRDETLVHVSGPIANVALAFAFGALLRATPIASQPFRLVVALLQTTLIIGVLNLLPIPPLDGSRIITRFLPPRARDFYSNLQPYGALFMLVIFFVLSSPIGAFVSAVGGGICQAVAGFHCL